MIPTPEQFRDFIRAAEQTRTGRELVVWLWVRALAGLRPSECLFLEWPDINFDREVIEVVSKKDKGNPLKKDAERSVEMHPKVKEILLGWKAHWDSVFGNTAPPHQWIFFHPQDPTKRVIGFRTAFEHAGESRIAAPAFLRPAAHVLQFRFDEWHRQRCHPPVDGA